MTVAVGGANVPSYGNVPHDGITMRNGPTGRTPMSDDDVDDLDLATVNGPELCAASGSPEALDHLAAKLDER